MFLGLNVCPFVALNWFLFEFSFMNCVDSIEANSPMFLLIVAYFEFCYSFSSVADIVAFAGPKG